MHMHLESRNREAFELVTDALQCIDQYRATRDLVVLDTAKEKLTRAIGKDPGYFRASYYAAIVDDLSGRSDLALATLRKLEDENPPFVTEVRYNRGVAEYHHYNHEALDRAILLFESVVADERSALPLRLLAQAGLAQSHAMHMIPKLPSTPEVEQITHHFDLAKKAAAKALTLLKRNRWSWRPFAKPRINEETANEVKWTTYNARGMALMYSTDYLPTPTTEQWKETRIRTLEEAIKAFEVANRISPRNWANFCDMASARMRVAYYRSDSSLFGEATRLLDDVTTLLRPGYGFALYEKGRVLRLRGHFEAAQRQLDAVLKLPPTDRYDVSERRIRLERDRAMAGDKSFP
jgi:tetratricopeptide (TPR) repeat protein